MAKQIAVTNDGRANTTAALVGAARKIGWGTSNASPAARADAALTAEATEARVAATVTRQTVTSANDTIQAVGRMVCAGAQKEIREAGLFEEPSLTCRVTHDPVVLDPGEAIEYTFQLVY